MNDPFLHFTESFFSRLNIHCSIQDIRKSLTTDADLGLRKKLYTVQYDSIESFHGIDADFYEKHQIIVAEDRFDCHFLSIPIPNQELPLVLFAGPYLTERKRTAWIHALIARQNIPASFLSELQQYYENLPIIDQDIMENYIHALAQQIYGDTYSISRTREEAAQTFQVSYRDKQIDPMQADHIGSLEKRYAVEEKMLEAISQGNATKAVRYLRDPVFGGSSLEDRFSNTLASTRHYLTVLNTLCRKAAQRGRVHPVYLDEISRRFSIEINHMNSVSKHAAISTEMVQRYCSLVLEKGSSNQSPIITRTILYIDFHLEDPALSLTSIADALSVNKSYLSACFKKETGDTPTSYIHRKRIEHASFLLSSGNLPIQEIAIQCGIPDLTYFTRVFKKEMGMNPSEYRKWIGRNERR